MTTDKARRLAHLFQLGESEATVLDHVLRHGSTTAVEVSPVLGKSRSRAYEVLRRLVGHGLLVEEAGRPLRFRPSPLREALASLDVDLSSRVQLVRETLENATEDAAVAVEKEQVSPSVLLVKGHRAIERQSASLVRSARRSIFLVASRDGDGGLLGAAGTIAALESAARAHINVLLVTTKTRDAQAIGRRLATAGKSTLHIEHDLPPLACIGTEAAVLFIFPTAPRVGAPRLAVRIDGAELADLTLDAIQRLAGVGDEATTTDGARFADEHVRAISRAAKEVLMMPGPSWGSLFRAGEIRRIRGELEQAAERGVQVRALAAGAHEQPLYQARMGKGPWETRVAAQGPYWLVVIDACEVHEAVHDPGTGQTLFRRTRDPVQVRFCRAMFEASWDRARHGRDPSGEA